MASKSIILYLVNGSKFENDWIYNFEIKMFDNLLNGKFNLSLSLSHFSSSSGLDSHKILFYIPFTFLQNCYNLILGKSLTQTANLLNGSYSTFSEAPWLKTYEKEKVCLLFVNKATWI